MSAAVPRRRASTARPAQAGPGEVLALFSDCLLVGLFMLVSTVGVVTAYPGLVAGVRLLRAREATEARVTPSSFFMTLRQVLASGLAGPLVPGALAALIAVDLAAVGAGVPGGRVLGVLLVAISEGAILLGLRMAGRWRPGWRWPEVAGAALARTTSDPAGDGLLLLAGNAAIALSLLVPLVPVLIGGPLALAVAAVNTRGGPDLGDAG